MKKYIFTERNGIYIIDLQKTVKKAEEAYMFIREVAANLESPFCLLARKSRRVESIEQEAKRCDMFYVIQPLVGRHAYQL